jgi:hypothetical protein
MSVCLPVPSFVLSPPPAAHQQFDPDAEAEDRELFERTSDGLGRRQLGAMLKKNYLLKKRAWCQTLCECIAPIFLTLLILVGFRLSANSATTTPPTIYVNQSFDLGGVGVQGIFSLLGLQTGGAASSAGASGGSSSFGGFDTSSTGIDASSLSSLIRTAVTYAGPLPIPSFDLFVSAHNALNSYLLQDNATTLQAVNRLSIADSRFNVLVNLGKLSFAPDIPEVRSLVSQLRRNHLLFNDTLDKIYRDESSAVDFALRDFTLDEEFDQRDPYKLRSWAVIVFDEIDLQKGRFDYSIRMNYSVIPTTRQNNQKFKKGYDDTYLRYFLSGFLTLQQSIEAALIDVIAAQPPGQGFATNLAGGRGVGGLSSIRGNFGSLLTAPMPVQSAYSNPFYTASGPFVGLVLCLSLLYPVSRLIKQLVEDKESRMKETLKMMGLYNWVFVTSYGITYTIIFTFIAILQTALMGGSVMAHSSKPLLFIYFWFFALSMMSLAFLISVFFSKAKLAGIVGPIICFAFVMPRYAFLTSDDNEQLGGKFFTCILSPTAFAFAMDNYMVSRAAGVAVWMCICTEPV